MWKVDSFIPSSVSPQKSQNTTTGGVASIFNISRGTATTATLKPVKCHRMQEKIVSAKKRALYTMVKVKDSGSVLSTVSTS